MNGRDHTLYTDSMSKSIWDKAFFMDKIEGVDAVIDFGCADGSMIRMLSILFPGIDFIGYDSDQEMIEMARKKNKAKNVEFFWKDEIDQITRIFGGGDGDHICLNFSSVLHEVYSFPEEKGMDTICYLAKALNPKYITIRDMYFSTAHYGECTLLTDTQKEHFASALRDPHAKEFEDYFGSISTWEQLTHFLMKYQWIDNGWEEEMRENYYSWNSHWFLNDIKAGYDIIFETHYQLPHLLERWKREYGIIFPNIHTHAQFILRKDD